MLLKIFLKHEILNLLKSQRIFTTVIIFMVLFASIFIVRVIDYQKQMNQYYADVMEADELIRNAPNYSHLTPQIIHKPLLFSIYNQGYTFGRVVNVEFFNPITSSEIKNESRNRSYRINQQIDITFLVTFFLSLFILLISYDTVNGEKSTGTLRLLLTFPIKRQSFVLKKILGVFIFVAIVFTIPYFLSLLTLALITSQLTNSFFLSALFYWFFVLLFIFFFCLLGTLLSCLSINPSKSLVYSLLLWIMICIILPVGWNQMVSPKIFDDSLNQYWQIYTDHYGTANEILYNPPDEANLSLVSNVSQTGDWFYRCNVWGFTETHEQRSRFYRYAYDKYYPASLELEQALDNYHHKRINIENIRNIVFFFNPIVLFNDIGRKISGNSRADYIKFLHDSREIRNDLVSLGAREGWLFGYGFTAMYEEKDILGSVDEWMPKFMNGNPEEVYAEVMGLMAVATPYTFEKPFIRSYQQPNPSFNEIFSKLVSVLTIFVVSILALWVLTWVKFMKYDVR
jgi:ABC-type transport system involved in multi-copper enzyme maturation permease subunit